MVVVTSSHSKAELKADDVVFVKAVALQGVGHDDCLLNSLEVCEAKVHFARVLGLSWHQAQLLKSWEGPEQVGDLPLCSIMRQSLDIDRLRRIGRVLHYLWKLVGNLSELRIDS